MAGANINDFTNTNRYLSESSGNINSSENKLYQVIGNIYWQALQTQSNELNNILDKIHFCNDKCGRIINYCNTVINTYQQMDSNIEVSSQRLANNISIKKNNNKSSSKQKKQEEKSFFEKGWDEIKDFGNDIADTAAEVGDWIESKVEDAGEWINDVAEETGAAISSAFKSFVSDMSDVVDKVSDVAERCGATFCNFCTSFTWGLADFTEGMVDALDILGTSIISIGTGAYDIGNYAYSKITGKTFESVTKKRWEQSEEFVSQDITSYYEKKQENTEYVQWLKEKSYAYEDVKNVSKIFGGISGAVMGSWLTGALGIATELGQKGLSILGGIFMGSSSLGSSTEKAWNEGASIGEGLAYGGINALFDGASYVVGAKLGQTVVGGGTSILSKIGTAFFRVGTDSADGFISSFGQTLFQKIYKDESLSEIFAENGGWKSVIVNTAIAGGLSSISTIFDIKNDNLKDQKTSFEVDTDSSPTMTKLSLDEQIEKANIEIEKGHFVSIDIDSIDDISYNDIKKIKDPSQILYRLKDGTILNESQLIDRKVNKFNSIISEDNFKSRYTTAIDDTAELTQEQINEDLMKTYRKIQEEFNYYKNIKSDSNYIYGLKTIDYYKKHGYTLEEIKSITGLDVDGYIRFEDGYKDTKFRYNAYMKRDNQYYVDTNSEIVPNRLDDWLCNFDEYGVDQGVFKELTVYRDRITGEEYSYYDVKRMERYSDARLNNIDKYCTEEYAKLKTKLINNGYSKRDAAIIINGVDSIGACSYASAANEIFNAYKYNPEKFYKDFGFSMYIQRNGKTTLNSSELILDMYITVNDTKYGGKLISNNKVIDITDDVDLYNRNTMNSKNQQYLATMTKGRNEEAINNYLKSKKINLRYKSEILFSRDFLGTHGYTGEYSYDDVIEIARKVQAEIDANKNISMAIANNDFSEIRMIPLDDKSAYQSTDNWNEGGSHSIFVTAATKDGYIVSSWGGRYLIPYEDLTDGASYNITISEITKSLGFIRKKI